MNRRCDRCEFWHSPQNISSNYGDCRRNTPQRASSGLGGWPSTRPEHWCGEFRARHLSEQERISDMAQSHSRASDPFGLGLSPLIGQKSSGF